jgi:hypothetical protein
MQTAIARYGISRTVAYSLLNRGLLEGFRIGARRYLYIDSLDGLPQALQDQAACKDREPLA